MTTLNIEGRKVKVSDEFLSLSEEQQAATVEEIARSLSIEAGSGPKHPIMSQVNRGIADSVGGLVDLVNPFDKYTGSAKTGLTNLMESGGIEVAQGDPETLGQAFARGSGEAAGAMIPATKGLQVLGKAGGMVGQFADDAARAMLTPGSAAVETLSGGVSETARKGAKDAGAPDWVQDVAAIAAPAVAVPAGVAALKQTAKLAPSAVGARAVGRKIKAAVAPYTEKGAREVARNRLQGLAGGEDRARELGKRISVDDEFGLTPAQQTNDPNMLSVEQLAADQSPLLRVELENRFLKAGKAGKDALQGMGGDTQAARSFFAQRRAAYKTKLQTRADKAIEAANKRIAALSPSNTESDNSLVVKREIDRALGSALSEENRLWRSIPKDAQVGTANAKTVAQKLASETSRAQQGDIPRAVRTLLLDENGLGDVDTVQEVYGLYSELRRASRSAMAGNDQNKNMARIADEVAEALLKDLGAVDAQPAIGRKINQARAFSAALHETYDRGAVGRILKRSLDGDAAIDPELAMRRSVGRSGAEAAVASRQIETATNGEAAPKAIQDYIKDRFSKAAVSATGEFNRGSAAKFARDNVELLNRYPQLRDEIRASVAQRESADQFATRIVGKIRALEDTRRSAGAAFLNGPPEKAIRSIIDAKVPANAARQLASEARKDPTGEALAGLKGAFADHLISTSRSGTDGISGAAMSKVLADPKMKVALRQVFSSAELQRLHRITAAMNKLEAATAPTPSIGNTLSGAQPNRLIEYLVRIVAARHGASLGGTAGGSLQTAQMASSRMKELINSLASDKASQILSDAVTDPELFRSLLMDTRSVSIEARALPKLIPYLIGGTAAAMVDSEGAK